MMDDPWSHFDFSVDSDTQINIFYFSGLEKGASDIKTHADDIKLQM